MAKFKKILLTGINGQVGNALYPKLGSLGEVIAFDRKQLDLADADAIRSLVQSIKPDLIINPAAYTAVDKAESEPDLAYAINATAPGILAQEAAKLGALLVHYSTDYVFDGSKASPYVETDIPNPLGVYGATKLAGEQAILAAGGSHLIFRTSWVYGAYGKNFLRTIIRLATERDHLKIVVDQFGSPTSSESISDATISALKNWDESKNGLYHLVNTGETSWHGFAREIVTRYSELQAEKNWPSLKTAVENVSGITTAEYPTPAKRPANSRMEVAKLATNLGVTLPPWQLALEKVLTHSVFDLTTTA